MQLSEKVIFEIYGVQSPQSRRRPSLTNQKKPFLKRKKSDSVKEILKRKSSALSNAIRRRVSTSH